MIVLRADRHEPCPGGKKHIRQGHMLNSLREGGAGVSREKYLNFWHDQNLIMELESNKD